MSDRPPSLSELQHWMKWIITDPRGTENALREAAPTDAQPIHRYQSPPFEALSWISSDSHRERVSRIDVYAEAYFARIHESISLDYPRTREFLGDEYFMKQVASYLKYHPSRTPNLGEVGLAFPDWLGSQAVDPWEEFAADLARLERNRIYAFYAPFGPPSDFSRLATLTESDWASLVLILDPSVFLIQSSFELLESEPRRVAEAQSFVTYRDSTLSPISTSIRTQEHFIFEQSQKGIPLLRIIDQLDEADCGLQEIFETWGNRGVIKTIQLETKK